MHGCFWRITSRAETRIQLRSDTVQPTRDTNGIRYNFWISFERNYRYKGASRKIQAS